MYNERGQLEKIEPVPFRLTRNLTAFFTAFGVEGVFTTTMANAALALTAKTSNAPHFLSLFFRWAARRRARVRCACAVRRGCGWGKEGEGGA